MAPTPVRVHPPIPSGIPDPPLGYDPERFAAAFDRAWQRAVRHWAGRSNQVPLISTSPIVDVYDDRDDYLCQKALGSIMAPDGLPFTWGTILQVMSFGEYHILTYTRERYGNETEEAFEAAKDEDGLILGYHGYLNRVDIRRGFRSFDETLVGLVAVKYEGGSKGRCGLDATGYFGRMIGADW